MAGRGRTTFQKRQKEQARLERRQQKAARKEARKAAKENSPVGAAEDWQQPEAAEEEDSPSDRMGLGFSDGQR